MCIHCAHANPSRPCQNQQLQVVSRIFTLSIKYKFGDLHQPRQERLGRKRKNENGNEEIDHQGASRLPWKEAIRQAALEYV